MSENGTGPKPIFNLDDLTEPGADLIVGGATYHYVRWGGLGLLARNQIQKRFNRIDELEKLEDPTEEHATEYERLTRSLLASITDVPADVIDGIEHEWRGNALSYFLAWRALTTQQRQNRMALALPSAIATPVTTAPSSPRSSGSTRKTGQKSG
jgi:hypothetical protein